jgi:tetratricopeptide (TPR) repeat protein
MQTAYTLGYLALISQNLQKYDEAEKYMVRAIEIAKNLHGENHPNTASMHKALALILWAQETRFMDAVKEMQRVLQIDETVYGKTSKEVASDLDFLASAYRFQAKYDEALPFLTRALDILNTIPTTQPDDFSSMAFNLADTYSCKHNYAEGEAVCKSMNGIFEKRSQRNPESDLLVNDCLANVYFKSGNYAAEAEALKSSITIDEKLGAQKEDAVAGNLTFLAASFLRQMKYDDALAALRRAEKIYNKKPSTPDVNFLAAMARYYYFAGKYAESEPFFIKAIALVEPKKDISSELIAALYRKGYALSLYAQGKTAQADQMFRKAIDKLKVSKINGERDVSTSYHELATLLTSQGKYAEAEPLFKQAIELREKALGAEHPDLAASLEGYAGLLKKTGRAAEAAPLESRAQAIRAKQPSR